MTHVRWFLLGVAALAVFVVMSMRGPVAGGAWIAGFACVACALAILWRDIEIPRVNASAVLSIALFVVALRLAVRGTMSPNVAAIAVPVLFTLVLVSLVQRPHRRWGFWLLAVHGAIALPRLGSFGLFDPWESHYGEVAREMISRDDWISLWWGHEGWFTSKPVLVFWLEAISMRALGVDASPDRVLATLHPEWALRLPAFLFSALGIYVLYKCFSRLVGERASFFGALALVTLPQFVLLARQGMPDMILVGSLSCAMGFVLVTMHAPLSAKSKLAPWIASIALACVIAQAVWLVTRNCTLTSAGFEWHLDRFRSGSAGNCDLGGQPACVSQPVYLRWLQPALQGVFWIAMAVPAAIACARERSLAGACARAAWMFMAIATMAKGPAGIVLPLAVTISYAITSGRSLRALFPWDGIVLCVALVVPWYVATFARHGRLYFDELVMRHMIGRTLEHLHDTNEGDDTSIRYYAWQLGYALFPWTGVVFLGLVRALRKRGPEAFLALWAIAGFGLFTIMRTKFHHYIFPVVPALGMLGGITLTRVRVVTIFGAAIVALVGWDLATHGALFLNLFTYQYKRPWPEALDFHVVLAASAIVATACTLFLRHRVARFSMFGVGIITALVLSDEYIVRLAPHWGQRAVFDAYYASRTGKEPLVAYQLNWKGENFYSGNHLGLFMSSGAPMQSWIQKRVAAGDRTLYFITEQDRVSSLKMEIQPKTFEVLVDRTTSNKFTLVRASL